MLGNGAEVQLSSECVDSWKRECIFSFMSVRLRAPLLCFLSETQIRRVGLMELGTDRPALFQLQWLWKNWIWTLLTNPPRARFQLLWQVAKDYFILTHVKSELTYRAKPQPAEPSVSECKLISLAVCYCLESPATEGMEQPPPNETFQASLHVKYCMLLPPSLQPVHQFLFIRKWNEGRMKASG